MNSAKRFDMFRMFFSVLIALLISFVIIFFVSEEPVTAIATPVSYTHLTLPTIRLV